MHGLRQRVTPSLIITNTLQLNSLAQNIKQNSLFKNTGNLISQFFDESKQQPMVEQTNDAVNLNDSSRIVNFMI